MQAGYARHFFAALAPRLNVSTLMDVQGMETARAGLPALASAYGMRSGGEKLYEVLGGVAVVPIEGTLVHKSGYVGSNSGTMGYDGIQTQLQAALADPAVKGILLDCDSPGGEVAGVQELGRIVANSSKPIWGHANEQAASACYWLLSQCSQVYLSETAEVGSIGVLVAHADYSAALEQDGVKVTLIHSGANKVDGNPYEALPEAVRADLQTSIDDLRGFFAEAVSAGRNMSVDQVMGTEARMYRGQQAVSVGLADKVMSFDNTLAQFQATLASSGVIKKGKTMSNRPDASAPPDQAGTITTAEHSAAIATATQAASTEAHATGHAAGMVAGATAERARISAILTHENANGRETTAREFALGTDMSAEAAIKILASVPSINGKQANALAQMGDVAVVRSEGADDTKSTLAQRIQAHDQSRKRG